jgi:transposase
MKMQEVILRAMAKRITWWQTAEIIGISDRQMRRWRERYEEFGFRGLFDRRRGKPSPKRVPVATLERVLELYREQYFDLNVRHFHEKLAGEHQIELSYSWVKGVLQGAGLMGRGRKRGQHRKRRPRRPLPGMLLHIDGSEHRWFQDERWYDLLVILDDASSEIYYAQLVEEESSTTVLAGLQEVIARKGVFCALYSESRQPFLADAESRRGRGSQPSDPSGTGLARVGDPDDSGLLAAGARTQRAQLRHLARTAAPGVAAGGVHHPGGCQSLPAPALHRRVQSPLSGEAGAGRKCFCTLPPSRSGGHFLPAMAAHGESRPHRQL